jgi:DNA-binding transcriptional ArsR family regulator
METDKNLARKFQVMSDPKRLQILCYIFNSNNKCVSDIAGELGMSVAITSHHLKSLARAGFLEPVRNGKHICYKLSKSKITHDLKKFVCKYQ